MIKIILWLSVLMVSGFLTGCSTSGSDAKLSGYVDTSVQKSF